MAIHGSRKKTAGLYIGSNAASAIMAEWRSMNWELTGFGRAHGPQTRGAADFANYAKRAVAAAGIRKGGVAVSIPDRLAHAVILEFDELPVNKADADEVIKLRCGRFLNINLLDYSLSHHTLSSDKPVKVLVVAVKRDIIEGIEDAAASLNLYVKRINVHSLNLLNLFLYGRETPEDISVITFLDDYFTVAIFRGGRLEYYRCREAGGSGVLRDLGASFISYMGKRHGSRLGKVYLFDAMGGFSEQVRDMIETEVEEIRPEDFLSLNAFSLDGESHVALLAALGAGI